jgi:hypothetical protein
MSGGNGASCGKGRKYPCWLRIPRLGKCEKAFLAPDVLPPRGKPKPPKEPKTPRVAELLRKAIEWRRQLDAGEVRNQAAIARREGITRARVTQIMGMLRLAPEIQSKILSMPGGVRRSPISERMLRPIGTLTDHRDQVQEFENPLV